MPRLISNYYWREEEIPLKQQLFQQGFAKIQEHKLFQFLDGEIHMKPNREYRKGGCAMVEKKGFSGNRSNSNYHGWFH